VEDDSEPSRSTCDTRYLYPTTIERQPARELSVTPLVYCGEQLFDTIACARSALDET
jgi:hypothetical protein